MKLSENHLRWLVLLISLHSLLVGLILFVAPQWAARFGGWGGIQPEFFGRQAGAFHLVVVCGYLIEYFRYRGVTLLVTAKSIAVVFLTLSAVIDGGPWAVAVSAAGDGLMALMVVLVYRWSRSASPAGR